MKKMEKRVSYVDLLVMLRAHKEPTFNGLVNHMLIFPRYLM